MQVLWAVFAPLQNEDYELLYSTSILEQENEVALVYAMMLFFTVRPNMFLFSLQTSMVAEDDKMFSGWASI